jgi:L-fuconolactonase
MRLAIYPNISVKLSAAPALSTQCYPFEDLWPYVHQVVGAFGPERVMWGSDWTRVAGFVSYDEGIGYIATTDELSKHDKSLILGQSLRRVFGWNR